MNRILPLVFHDDEDSPPWITGAADTNLLVRVLPIPMDHSIGERFPQSHFHSKLFFRWTAPVFQTPHRFVHDGGNDLNSAGNQLVHPPCQTGTQEFTGLQFQLVLLFHIAPDSAVIVQESATRLGGTAPALRS